MCEREKGARATVPHKGVCARKMLQVTGITKLLEEISFYGVGNIFKYKSIFFVCKFTAELSVIRDGNMYANILHQLTNS